MRIIFPGGARVDAHFGPYVVRTDQPAPVGEGSAPPPFALFLASLGTCAGIYVLSFLQARGLPWQDVNILQRVHSNPQTGMVERVELRIHVPQGFPEKYLPALERAAEQCAVKKHFDRPPRVMARAAVMEGETA
jgi:ribosomal protein S12 methylthiotransferase accessory factor